MEYLKLYSELQSG